MYFKYSCVADCAGAVAPGCNNVCAPTNCALTGRKRRAILDAPITGLYRPDNLMTPDDKARYIRSLKASDTSSNDSLSRNERDLEVGGYNYQILANVCSNYNGNFGLIH